MCATHILTWNNNICWRTNERIERKGSSMREKKNNTQLNCIKLNIIVRKNRISNANVNIPTWCPCPSPNPSLSLPMDYVFAFDAEQEQVLYNAAAYAFVINYTRVHDAVQIHIQTYTGKHNKKTRKRPSWERGSERVSVRKRGTNG